MQLEQRFTIPVDRMRAWDVLLDIERLAPCFPGAAVTEVSDASIKGGVKIKLGPVLLNYKGTATFLERDAEKHRVVLEAQGADGKGGSTATATVEAVLMPVDENTTECVIQTDLNITGRPAQFGRGMMTEVGNKITAQFASNLAKMLTTTEGEPDASALSDDPYRENSSSSQEPLDILSVAKAAALKRLAAATIAAVGLLVLIRVQRLRNNRRVS